MDGFAGAKRFAQGRSQNLLILVYADQDESFICAAYGSNYTPGLDDLPE